MTVVRLTVRAPRGLFAHWASLFGLSLLVHLGVLLGIIVLPRVFQPRLKFPEIYSVNLVSLPAGAPGPRESGPPAEKASVPAPPAPAPKPAPAPPPKAKAQPAIKIPEKPTVTPKPKKVTKPAPATKPKQQETKAEAPAASQEAAEKAQPTREEAAGTGGEASGTASVQAPGGQGVGAGGGGGSGGMVDDPAFQFGWYVSNIQSIVSRNWSQPIIQDVRRSLVAVVHFRVHKDGRVDEIVLERSSGDSVLDRSAVRALQDSNPLPPLPYQWSKESIGFRFEFEIQPD